MGLGSYAAGATIDATQKKAIFAEEGKREEG